MIRWTSPACSPCGDKPSRPEDAFRLRRGSDGALRWHLSRAFPLKDAEGRVLRWFGTNTDIHDQRLALEERERLLKEAQGEG